MNGRSPLQENLRSRFYLGDRVFIMGDRALMRSDRFCLGDRFLGCDYFFEMAIAFWGAIARFMSDRPFWSDETGYVRIY
ncbi:MAG TPA: hypothetical protein V6C58_18135 [Allocoleopsis sp.]